MSAILITTYATSVMAIILIMLSIPFWALSISAIRMKAMATSNDAVIIERITERMNTERLFFAISAFIFFLGSLFIVTISFNKSVFYKSCGYTVPCLYKKQEAEVLLLK